MYAVTLAISAGVRMRFGIFGCELVKKTRMAVAVIPGVFAMSRNAGPILILRGARASGSTVWQALQVSRAKACPAATSPSCAFALNAVAAREAAERTTAHLRHMVIPFTDSSDGYSLYRLF